MSSAFSFDPFLAPAFFTVTDHRSAFLREGNSLLAPAPDSLVEATLELLQEFFQVSAGTELRMVSSTITTRLPIDGMLYTPASNMTDWTYHLPYYPTPKTGYQFSTFFGFGIPAGPTVIVGDYSDSAADDTSPPNHLATFLLKGVLQDMLRRGREVIRRETEYKFAVLNGVLQKHPQIRAVVSDPGQQNKMVLAAQADIHADRLEVHLKSKGIRCGRDQNNLLFANTPAHSRETVELLADQIELFR